MNQDGAALQLNRLKIICELLSFLSQNIPWSNKQVFVRLQLLFKAAWITLITIIYFNITCAMFQVRCNIFTFKHAYRVFEVPEFMGKTNFISKLHPKLSYTKFNFWSSYFSFLSAPSIYKIIGLGTLNIHAKNKNALVSQFKVKRAVYVFAWVLLADLLCLFSSMQEWCGHWSSILSDFGKSEKHHVAFVFDSWCVLLWIKEVAFFCHITHCDIVLTQLISFNIVIFFFSYSDLFIKSNDTVSKV